MKKLIIVTAITAIFSTMATAGGLADRINEASSYPNKTISTERSEMACAQNKTNHRDVSKSELKYQENKSGNKGLDHAHS